MPNEKTTKIKLAPSVYNSLVNSITVVTCMSITGDNYNDKSDDQKKKWSDIASVMVDSYFSKEVFD